MATPSSRTTSKVLRLVGNQKTSREYRNQQTVFSQGDAADAMFYIQSGTVKLTVEPRRGKRAVIAILQGGDLFGEGCLTTRSIQTATATTIEPARIARVKKQVMVRAIHKNRALAKLFISHLHSRVVRAQEDLVDQLCNPSEKRLARVLLLLSGFREHAKPTPKVLHLSQHTLAEMVGTTRSRISFFMNRFRRRGFVRYDPNRGVHVQRGLFKFLQDRSQ